jgi:hypothetical protein
MSASRDYSLPLRQSPHRYNPLKYPTAGLMLSGDDPYESGHYLTAFRTGKVAGDTEVMIEN